MTNDKKKKKTIWIIILCLLLLLTAVAVPVTLHNIKNERPEAEPPVNHQGEGEIKQPYTQTDRYTDTQADRQTEEPTFQPDEQEPGVVSKTEPEPETQTEKPANTAKPTEPKPTKPSPKPTRPKPKPTQPKQKPTKPQAPTAPTKDTKKGRLELAKTEAKAVVGKIITPEMSKREKAEAICMYITKTVESQTNQSSEAYKTNYGNEAYAALIMKIAACSGRCKAVTLLCDEAGLESQHINKGQWTHQWNKVKIDEDNWIVIDSEIGFVGEVGKPHPIEGWPF